MYNVMKSVIQLEYKSTYTYTIQYKQLMRFYSIGRNAIVRYPHYTAL